jgi:hypothetical protein
MGQDLGMYLADRANQTLSLQQAIGDLGHFVESAFFEILVKVDVVFTNGRAMAFTSTDDEEWTLYVERKCDFSGLKRVCRGEWKEMTPDTLCQPPVSNFPFLDAFALRRCAAGLTLELYQVTVQENPHTFKAKAAWNRLLHGVPLAHITDVVYVAIRPIHRKALGDLSFKASTEDKRVWDRLVDGKSVTIMQVD